MQFLTLITAGILLLALLLYYLRPLSKYRMQNLLLTVASFACFALTDWKLMVLVAALALMSFVSGKLISVAGEKSKKRTLLIINTVVLLAVLLLFRHFNFFINDINRLLGLIGLSPALPLLKVVVPLGISIYTLQAMSYTFDVYREKIQPLNDITAFMAWVAFFPQMFAGPVERASVMIPQFTRDRNYSNKDAAEGAKRILLGLFKKLVIANNMAFYAEEIFNSYSVYSGFTILAGLLAFAFQLWADLSGLADVATGTARLFGIRLSNNFRFPYFATSLRQFWSKWNISLMAWLNEYVYIPMGGDKGSSLKVFRNLFIFFLLVGLWHGGNISFLLFALINALLILPATLRTNRDEAARKGLPAVLGRLAGFLLTALLLIIGLTFFRAATAADAWGILKNLTANVTTISVNELRSLGDGLGSVMINAAILGAWIVFEWCRRKQDHVFDMEGIKPWLQTIIYITVLILLLFFHQPGPRFTYLSY